MALDFYTVKISRPHDSAVSNDVTCIFIINGRPRPLADDAWLRVELNDENFEIPVFITDNEGTEFEGVLAGTADGKDIEIQWAAVKSHPMLGILYSENKTVHFIERPGAANNW